MDKLSSQQPSLGKDDGLVLRGKDAEKFVETLLNPPVPNEALRAANEAFRAAVVAKARAREDELIRAAYELLCECEHVEETDERGMTNFIANVRERLARKDQVNK